MVRYTKFGTEHTNIKEEIMKKIAKWLSEHAVVLGSGGKDSVLHLWCIVIAFVLMTFFGIMGWNGKAFEWLCGVLFLGGSVLPPIVAGVVALVKGEKWEPWYWFPIVIGFVIGGLLAIAVGFVGGWCKL